MNSMSETFDLAHGDPRSRLVEELRCQVGTCEAAASQDEISFSTGTPPLDDLLGTPLRYGMLIEWLRGLAHSGAATLSLLCAREACRAGGTLVVIDRLQTFYPPAAAAWGIDLGRLIIVRPRGMRDALWATLQSLRSPAVAAVWAPLEKLDSREFRQLQLAAQTGRTLGLLLRPAYVRGQPSWADVRLLVEPPYLGKKQLQNANCKMQIANWQDSKRPPSSAMNILQFALCNLQSPLRFVHVRVLRQRGARPSQSIFLEINDATHTIQESCQPSAISYQPNLRPQSLAPSPQPHASFPLFMAPELADPAARSHPARA
jgi:hypothetical protein